MDQQRQPLGQQRNIAAETDWLEQRHEEWNADLPEPDQPDKTKNRRRCGHGSRIYLEQRRAGRRC